MAHPWEHSCSRVLDDVCVLITSSEFETNTEIKHLSENDVQMTIDNQTKHVREP